MPARVLISATRVLISGTHALISGTWYFFVPCDDAGKSQLRFLQGVTSIRLMVSARVTSIETDSWDFIPATYVLAKAAYFFRSFPQGLTSIRNCPSATPTQHHQSNLRHRLHHWACVAETASSLTFALPKFFHAEVTSWAGLHASRAVPSASVPSTP